MNRLKISSVADVFLKTSSENGFRENGKQKCITPSYFLCIILYCITFVCRPPGQFTTYTYSIVYMNHDTVKKDKTSKRPIIVL